MPGSGTIQSHADLPKSGAAAHMVAVLPRGEALRNFVDTRTLDFVGREITLTVVSVVPNESAFVSLKSRYEKVLPLQHRGEPYPVRLARGVLDMAHGRALWSAAARERWRLRDEEARERRTRLKRVGMKMLSLPFSVGRGPAILSRIERSVSRALSPSEDYIRLYRELQPSLVFNGSHVHSAIAIQAVQAAQWLGIPTAAFIFSWDNLTSQGRIIPSYDYYLVWNEDLKRQLTTIYLEVLPEQVFVTGTPQFDFHFRRESYASRVEFCSQIGADPERPIVLYSTGMANHMRGEPAVVEQIADLLPSMPGRAAPQLVVRVYPKDRSGRFEPLKQRRPDILFPAAHWIDNWLTPTEDDTRLLTNMLRHADVGINVASTISLELCMFDKPVVNVGYDPPNGEAVEVPYARYYEFDHYRPLVASGAIAVAWSPEEMKQHIADALAYPDRLSERRQALLSSTFGNTLDGRSAERVAEVLVGLARGERVRG